MNSMNIQYSMIEDNIIAMCDDGFISYSLYAEFREGMYHVTSQIDEFELVTEMKIPAEQHTPMEILMFAMAKNVAVAANAIEKEEDQQAEAEPAFTFTGTISDAIN